MRCGHRACVWRAQAAARTNDIAGDGTTTATVLSAAFIAEGMKVVSAGTNPVQLVRGMEKTVTHLVKELKAMSTEIRTDKDLANVASVSAGALCSRGSLRCCSARALLPTHRAARPTAAGVKSCGSLRRRLGDAWRG